MSRLESASGATDWGPWILGATGTLLFSLGAARFAVQPHFGLVDALYCLLAIVPAALFLLVFDYVLHHARLAAVIPLIAGALLLYSSPTFDVALGLALAGTVAGPAFGEWKNSKRAAGIR